MEDRFHINDFKQYAHLNRFMEYNRIEIVELEKDHAILKHVMDENSENINHTAHGGLMFTMMDVAASAIIRKNDKNCTTSSITTNYLRPGKGTLYARAEFIKQGKHLCVVHSWCYDENNKLLCDSVVNLFIID